MGLYQIIDHLLKSVIVVVITIVAMVILMIGLGSLELGTGDGGGNFEDIVVPSMTSA